MMKKALVLATMLGASVFALNAAADSATKTQKMMQGAKSSATATSNAAADAAAATPALQNNIVAVATQAGQFTTLTAALAAAGLTQTLQTEGPFTVFAPTDAAFAALPAGTLENLMKPENKAELANLLKYHVVSGKIMAAAIQNGQSQVTTLNGQPLSITRTATGVTVNGAQVNTTDIAAANGVIHTLNQVVIPASPTADRASY